MALYPDRHSAALPALEAAQRVHGWCSPEAIEQVACVMRRDARLPGVGGHLLRHARDRARSGAQRVRVHEHLLLAARRRRAVRGARARPRARIASSTCARSSASGACDIAPMASVDGVYVGPLSRRGRAAAARRRARGARRAARASSSCASAPCADRARRQRRMSRHRCCCSPTSTSPGCTRSRSTSAAAATSRCARRWR